MREFPVRSAMHYGRGRGRPPRPCQLLLRQDSSYVICDGCVATGKIGKVAGAAQPCTASLPGAAAPAIPPPLPTAAAAAVVEPRPRRAPTRYDEEHAGPLSHQAAAKLSGAPLDKSATALGTSTGTRTCSLALHTSERCLCLACSSVCTPCGLGWLASAVYLYSCTSIGDLTHDPDLRFLGESAQISLQSLHTTSATACVKVLNAPLQGTCIPVLQLCLKLPCE